MIHIPTIEEIDLRIDKFVAGRETELSRSAIQKYIESGHVKVNGKEVQKSYKIKADDEISIIVPNVTEIAIEAENIPIEIVYEDDDLLVVNKPKGMVVHPAPGNWSGTLVNALMYHCRDSLSGINGELRPGIIHRIDKDTSGLLIVAKNDFAHRSLAEQIKEHSCMRCYEAICVGRFSDECGTVDAPIARHPVDRTKMAVVAGGKDAVTHWSVKEELNGFTHVSLKLETGRTHQIRVHMSSMGHPLYGDTVYGGGKSRSETVNAGLVRGQCLHAKTIGFIHPRTGEQMFFDSDLPEYFTTILNKLKIV